MRAQITGASLSDVQPTKRLGPIAAGTLIKRGMSPPRPSSRIRPVDAVQAQIDELIDQRETQLELERNRRVQESTNQPAPRAMSDVAKDAIDTWSKHSAYETQLKHLRKQQATTPRRWSVSDASSAAETYMADLYSFLMGDERSGRNELSRLYPSDRSLEHLVRRAQTVVASLSQSPLEGLAAEEATQRCSSTEEAMSELSAYLSDNFRVCPKVESRPALVLAIRSSGLSKYRAKAVERIGTNLRLWALFCYEEGDLEPETDWLDALSSYSSELRRAGAPLAEHLRAVGVTPTHTDSINVRSLRDRRSGTKRDVSELFDEFAVFEERVFLEAGGVLPAGYKSIGEGGR